jgi:hypothetical protein
MRKRDYQNLTPHQRLFLAGELQHFERRVLAGDEGEMIAILLKVELPPQRAREFTFEILADPRKFGYCEGGCLRR